MNYDLKLTVSESIVAPAAAVWKGLTDKEMIKKYFFGTEVESDWKAGSTIIFTGSWEGHQYIDRGTILEIEKEKLIKYNYWSSMSGLEDKPENYAIIIYRLNTNNGQTSLSVTQEGFKDRKACDHSAEGWKGVLRELKKLLEA